MARKKLSRNAPCPCGSGKKYTHCCNGTRFDYEQDDEGTIFKPIPMSQEMVDLLQEQRQKFIEKYRRESSGFHETAVSLRPVPFPYCCKNGRCRPRA